MAALQLRSLLPLVGLFGVLFPISTWLRLTALIQSLLSPLWVRSLERCLCVGLLVKFALNGRKSIPFRLRRID